MFSCSFEQLDSSLSNFYSKYLSEKTESLRIQISDNPKQNQIIQNFDFTRFHLKVHKDNQFVGLAILSWYMPDEIKFLLQLQLREVNLQAYDFRLMEILLSSKEYALGYLLINERWTERDFFGNVLDKKFIRNWLSVTFLKLSRKKVPRYTGYCRGYRDSNRRAPSPLPLSLRAKMTVKEEMLQKELRTLKTIQWIKRIQEVVNRVS